MKCINKSSREYRSLLEQSGLSDFELSAQVGDFIEKHSRFPHLDELVGVNSENFIREELKIRKSDDTTKTEEVLSATNSETIEDAIVTLNSKFRDKEIEISDFGGRSKFWITPRPSTTINPTPKNEIKENVNNMVYFNSVIDKLQDLYGIKIIPITNKELSSDEWQNVVGVNQVKAFVYNGNIYVNTDIATIDSPLHEMLHILFGSMKFQNRELYSQLVSQSINFDSYQEIAQQYPNRTQEDLNEEIFITELSKHLVGIPSSIDQLSDEQKYEIFYNVNRTLDTILFGDVSVNAIPHRDLYQLSLKSVAEIVNSAAMTNNFRGSMDAATLHRLLANKKSELIKEGELKEECE